jgi:cytochrome c556
MNRLIRIGVVLAASAASALALSQAGPPGPPSPEAQAASAVGTRQGLFKIISNQFGPIGGMLRTANPVPFDAALVARNSARIATLSEIIPELFVKDTREFTAIKTAALPGIWNSQADFKGKADALTKAANDLNAAAKGGNEAATKAAMGAVGKACAGCHDNYRQKNN